MRTCVKLSYDYLIVGAGLYGSVFAREMTEAGKKCLIIDRRPLIGGNVYCEEIAGIRVHRYGAHIFHTADEEVWQYVNRFVSFNRYVNTPLAVYGDEIYNLPFNMNTFSRLWNIHKPEEACEILAQQTAPYSNLQPRNLEEQALKLVGPDIYEKLIKGYTEKQWGRDCRQLPAFIIRRLPLRFTYDNNYFNDPHQGIPLEGYNILIEGLLEGSDVLLNTSYKDFIKNHSTIAARTLYTGSIDGFFDYRLGTLQYRTVSFEDQVLNTPNYQGNAVVNYTKGDVPYTRIIEHKHFEFGQQEKTVISREYPCEWEPGMEPYYPVNDETNQALYKRYVELSKHYPEIHFGGRLGEYKYYDMDKVIRSALDTARITLSRAEVSA